MLVCKEAWPVGVRLHGVVNGGPAASPLAMLRLVSIEVEPGQLVRSQRNVQSRKARVGFPQRPRPDQRERHEWLTENVRQGNVDR